MKNCLELLLILTLLIGCGDSQKNNPKAKPSDKQQKQKPKGPPPVNVEVLPLQYRPFKITLSAIGHAEPYYKSQVASFVAGRVESIEVKAGQKVKKGQVLATLEREVRKHIIVEKKAEIKRLEAELNRLNSGYLLEEVKGKEEQVTENEALLRQLDAELGRKKELYRQRNISKTQLEETLFAFEAQKARLKKARLDLELYKQGYRKELKIAAHAELEKTRAQLAREQYFFEQNLIRSPFDGVILEQHVEKGEWLKVGEPVVSIVDISLIKVVVFVPEQYISLINAAKSKRLWANIVFNALPHRTDIVGEVTEIVPQASLQSRNFPVRLLIDNSDGAISPGMSCTVFAVFNPKHKALMIHRDGFFPKQHQNMAIKVSEKKQAEYIPVIVGNRDGNWFELLESRKLLFSTEIKEKIHPGAFFSPLWQQTTSTTGEVYSRILQQWAAKNKDVLVKSKKVANDWLIVEIYGKSRLKEGDRVVITNNPYVRPGAFLNIVREYSNY